MKSKSIQRDDVLVFVGTVIYLILCAMVVMALSGVL